MLGLMHESARYGYLLVGGVSPSAAQLAAVLGDKTKDVERWLAELETVDVFSRDESGVIFSRRMVRDKAKREQDRINGKGGGNPKLTSDVNQGVNPPLKAQILDTRSQKLEPELPVIGRAKSRAKPKTRIPDRCPTDDGLEDAKQFWAVHARFDLLLDEQSAQFRDHHLKHGSTMADWDAAWRTWFRNALKFNRQNGNRPNGRPESPYEQSERIANQIIREDAGYTSPDPGPDRVPRIGVRPPSDERH